MTQSASRPAENPTGPDVWPNGLIQIGHVLDAWGTQGWVKIAPQSSEPAALLKARQWWMQSPQGRPLQQARVGVRLCRRHAQFVVALLDGTTSRTQAETLKGWTIHARREDFPPTRENEYYWVDLIGCTVRNREGLDLGTVSGLLDSGAQSILQLQTTVDDRQRERLIPFVDAYIVEVDIDARRIVADWQPDYD